MAYTNNDIYQTALSLIAERELDGDVTDLDERAPYLIASFCGLCKSLDKKLRERDSLEEQPTFSLLKLNLSESFPLSEPLVIPAATYLASMLIADENPSLSERLYDKYCDEIAMLGAECSCSAITNVYFVD